MSVPQPTVSPIHRLETLQTFMGELIVSGVSMMICFIIALPRDEKYIHVAKRETGFVMMRGFDDAVKDTIFSSYSVLRQPT